jgi:hypothetical protein
VGEEFEREAGSGIVNVNDKGAGGAEEGNAGALLGIGEASMLDGVHEQFAEGGGNVFAGIDRDIGQHFAKKMGGAVGGVDLAADVERDPLGAGRNDADIIFAAVTVEGLLDDIGDDVTDQRLVDVTEGMLADGADDAFGAGFAGNDDAGLGAEGTDAAHESEAVIAVAALAGKDYLKGGGAQAIESFFTIGGDLDGAVFAFEQRVEEFLDSGVGIDYQEGT